MNAPVISAVLPGPLASHPLLESIRDALTTGPQSNETVAFVGGLAAFVLLVMLAARLFGRERQAAAEPQVDYLTLAVDVLGLSENDRRDLQRIAGHAGLEHPVAMLLSPANLAHAAAPVLELENASGLRQRIERLCVQLFGTPLPNPGQLPHELF